MRAYVKQLQLFQLRVVHSVCAAELQRRSFYARMSRARSGSGGLGTQEILWSAQRLVRHTFEDPFHISNTQYMHQ